MAGLALRAGVNANQLRKWIVLDRKKADAWRGGELAAADAPVFVPVVELADDTPVRAAPKSPLMPDALPAAPCRREAIRASQRPPLPARLVAQLPNGVSVELECAAHDAALVTAMIETLGRCHVPARR